MSSLRPLFIALAVILVTARAQAESFDCARPGSGVARIVCADPATHAADQAESDAYDLALAAALDRPSLREEERLWFQAEILTASWYIDHGMKVDPAKLLQSYRQRTDVLRATARRWREWRRAETTAQAEAACLPLPSAANETSCTVADTGTVVGEHTLRYLRQNYGQPAAERAVIVFAPNDSSNAQWVPIAAAYSAHAHFAVPEAVDSPEGRLMMLAGDADAPDQEGVSNLYRFAAGTVEDIDDRTWLDTLKSRLPDGLLFQPGIAADYAKMTATATIAQSDSSCCPIGGHATIALGIADQRIVVKDVTFQAQ